MLRLRTWIVVALAVLLLAALAAGLWLAAAAWPVTGERRVRGLAAPVTVLRDDWSVPHVFAAGPEDGAFALGWVHADDRIWQMHGMRRLGAGRLAEMLGPAALPSDRWMRTLGLYRLAEAQYPRLEPATRRLFDAYAAGVNAWLGHHRLRPLPPEFLLLGIEPEPWTPADSLVWLKLMALRLSSDRHGELLRARLAARLTADQLADLWPEDLADTPATVEAIHGGMAPLQDMFERLAAAWPDPPGRTHGGSNVWAVAGSGTESGRPILANDPHLGFPLPLTWYLARIVTPEGELAGATSPGFPALLLGHNGRVAWGITTSDIDVEDLFIERITAGDPSRYDAPDGPLPFDVREEVIAVARAEPERLRVRSSRHGPILSDLPGFRVPDLPGNPPATYALALAAPYLRDDDRTADGLVRLNRAGDADQVFDAARLGTAPQQNLMFATVDGRIGTIAAGLVPLRPPGGGWLPRPGWSGAHDWTGFVPFEGLPQALDPPSGRLVNANNRPVPAGWPWPLRGAWDAGFRARRIHERLAADGPQAVAASAALQMDAVSLVARRLLPPMLAALPASADAASADAAPHGASSGGAGDARGEAVALLRAWDGTMAADRPEPLLFAAWLRALVRAIFADELGPAFYEWWDDRPLAVERALSVRPQWCDDVTTPATEDCAGRIAAALDAALADLASRLDGRPGDWEWGTLHRAALTNPLWDRIPLLRHLANLRPEVAGGSDTVDRAAFRSSDEEHPFAAVHGAGFRGVYDLADLAASRFVLAAGQSGHPLSPHYRDFTDLWRRGGGIPLAGSAEALQLAGASRLQLLPAGGSGD